MNRNTVFAALVLPLLMGAAACSTPAGGKGPPPLTPTQRFTLQVESAPEQIALAPHAEGLSDNQRAVLARFAQNWADAGGGPISVSTPQGGGDAASRTAWAVKALLQALGASAADVRVVSYTPEQPGGPVLVAFDRYAAVIPQCGEEWNNLGATRTNETQSNFGCATTANMAAMIENPADIRSPRALASGDAQRRSVVMGKYRNGEATGATAGDRQTGSVSRAVEQ